MGKTVGGWKGLRRESRSANERHVGGSGGQLAGERDRGDGYADRQMGGQSTAGDEKVDRRKERMMEMRKPNRSAAGRRAG